jgi:chromosomal replication initiation ATPase DnaA
VTGPAQLVLPLAYRPALTSKDFLVGPCNREAAAWVERWPRWPGTAVIVSGPAGSGKSHLVSIFLARSEGQSLAGADLPAAAARGLIEVAPATAIDDADRAVAAGLEEALLHVFNQAQEAGRSLLLTGQTPVAQWPMRLADLRSRLQAQPAVAIAAPEDDLLAHVMVKLFADRGIHVEQGVIAYALARMERSFAATRDLVARLDQAALGTGRRVTLGLVRAVLNRPIATGDDAG